MKGLTTKARTTHFFEPNARGAKSCPIAHLIRTLSKFELHRCLLRCERECQGSAYVGPKFGTHVPHLGAGEYLNFLILERLSRKLDASCTLVKLCWSLLRSAEAFSPGDRWGLLIYDAHASHGLARIGIPSAWMNPREKRASFSRADWKAGFDSLRY